MDEERLEIISKGGLEDCPLTEQEKEVALKILKDLDGTLVIRATSILQLCIKAVRYSEVKF